MFFDDLLYHGFILPYPAGKGQFCSRWFGLVALPACTGSPPQAALGMGLCWTLKDRHDLHQTTLSIIPAHIRDALFQVGCDDDGHAEGRRASPGGRLFCPGFGRPVMPRAFVETGRYEET